MQRTEAAQELQEDAEDPAQLGEPPGRAGEEAAFLAAARVFAPAGGSLHGESLAHAREGVGSTQLTIPPVSQAETNGRKT